VSRHTRAPWNYLPDDGTVRSEHRGKAHNTICEVGVRGVRLAKVDHANGHLISAAPTMYEAITAALQVICGPEDVNPWPERSAGWWSVEVLRAAKKKAEGGSE
jgi:hypothetical protein